MVFTAKGLAASLVTTTMLALALSSGQALFAQPAPRKEPPPAAKKELPFFGAKPAPKEKPPVFAKPAFAQSAIERLREVAKAPISSWERLARSAVEVGVGLLSGNEPHVLSENKAEVLSNNKSKILCENRISLLSGIKFEIRISDSANHSFNHGPGPGMPLPRQSGMPGMGGMMGDRGSGPQPQGPQTAPKLSVGPGGMPGMQGMGGRRPEGRPGMAAGPMAGMMPGRPGPQREGEQREQNVREAVQHLREAANLLQRAGEIGPAEAIRQMAERIGQSARPANERREAPAAGLQEEVRRLRSELEAVRREMNERRRPEEKR